MLFRTFTLVLALFILTFNFAEAGKLEKLMEKNFKATGSDKIGDVDLKITGKVQQMGMEIPFTVLNKKPNLIRFESEAMGQKALVISDGKKGFISQGGQNMEIPLDKVKGAVQPLQFLNSPFKDTEKAAKEFKLIGRETIDGKEAYKIKMTTNEGDEIFIFMGKKDNLVFQLVLEKEIQGQKQKIVIKLQDYKKVQTYFLPHKVELEVSGMVITYIYDKIEPGAKLTDSMFEIPKDMLPTQGKTKAEPKSTK